MLPVNFFFFAYNAPHKIRTVFLICNLCCMHDHMSLMFSNYKNYLNIYLYSYLFNSIDSHQLSSFNLALNAKFSSHVFIPQQSTTSYYPQSEHGG